MVEHTCSVRVVQALRQATTAVTRTRCSSDIIGPLLLRHQSSSLSLTDISPVFPFGTALPTCQFSREVLPLCLLLGTYHATRGKTHPFCPRFCFRLVEAGHGASIWTLQELGIAEFHIICLVGCDFGYLTEKKEERLLFDREEFRELALPAAVAVNS